MRKLAATLILALGLSPAWALETDDEEFLGLRFVKDSAGRMKTAGLGWHVTLEKEGCRLLKPLLVCSGRHLDLAYDAKNAWAVPSALGGFADFGLIRPPAGNVALKDIERDWTRATAIFAAVDPEGLDEKARELRVTVSRLSPAVLVESEGNAIELFAGNAPKCFAVGGSVCKAVALGRADLSPGWLLGWFGEETPFRAPGREKLWARGKASEVKWDYPVLVVFSESLRRVRAVEGAGLVFEFGGPAALAVLPLFGERPLLAAKGGKPPAAFLRRFLAADLPATAQWGEPLPRAVLERCRFWAERLAAFPVSVAETSTYDGAKDALTVKTSFTYRRLRRRGKEFAPVAPALALARRGGLPVIFSKEPVDSGYITPYGPWLGVEGTDGYRYTIQGLGRYVNERRRLGPETRVPRELQERLNAETDKVLAAGIMAPWFPVVNACNQRGYHKDPQRLAFSNPGENLYFITQLMAVADPGRREKLRELLAAWEEAYPCLQTVHMPPTLGARRERYYVHLQDLQRLPDKKRNFHFSHKVVPVENIYYYALACRHGAAAKNAARHPGEILEAYVRRTDWASSSTFRWDGLTYQGRHGWGTTYRDKEYGWSGVADANRLFAGLVGYIRLARMTGDEREEQRGWYFLSKVAALRLAMEKFKRYLYDEKLLAPPLDPKALRYQYPWQMNTGLGIHTFRRRGPDDDPITPALWDEFGVTMFETETHFWWLTRLVPYLGMVPELGRFLHDHAAEEARAYCAKIEESAPDWFAVMAECNWAGEQACLYPEDSYQIVLARAWIVGEPPERLWRYADLPWLARGDWYYIHKLAETIKAYRGWTWEK